MPRLLPLLLVCALCGCGKNPLAACDDAIKATLKAPSSYKRISASGAGVWRIEYDAVNSYNAPIRGHGTCYYTEGEKSALWIDSEAFKS